MQRFVEFLFSLDILRINPFFLIRGKESVGGKFSLTLSFAYYGIFIYTVYINFYNRIGY